MRSLLDHQADGIEYTLHTHGINANVCGGNISPRLIQFHIKLEAGIKYNRVAALADEFAQALGVQHCRIVRDGDCAKIEVSRPDPVVIKLFSLMRDIPDELPPNSAILGLDENGVPLLLRLDAPDISHILIAGMKGTGKTVLTRAMITSLALQNTPEYVKLLLIDTKEHAYGEFEGLPNLVCPIVSDVQDALHRLRWAVRHMEKRLENGVNNPLLVIFIDELADLLAVDKQETEYLLGRLTQRGQDTGVHVVACTQKPARNFLNGIDRPSFPTRVVGRVGSLEEARISTGVAASGADKLMKRADFLLFAKGEIIRVQAAHISSAEMEQTVVHLGGKQQVERPPVRRQLIKVVEEVEIKPEPEKKRATKARRTTKAKAVLSQADEAQMGISERLARYEESIYERRRQQQETDADAAAAEKPELSFPRYLKPLSLDPIQEEVKAKAPKRPLPKPNAIMIENNQELFDNLKARSQDAFKKIGS